MSNESAQTTNKTATDEAIRVVTETTGLLLSQEEEQNRAAAVATGSTVESETGGGQEEEEGEGDDDTANLHPVGHRLFVIISRLAVLLSVLMIAAQVATWASKVGGDILIQHILRIYILLLCIMFVLAELEWDFFLDLVPPLENWFYRGFLYSFVGVVGVEESYAVLAQAYPQIPGAKEITVSMYVKAVSIAMLCTGILYMIMAIFFLHGLFDRLQRRYEERRAARNAVTV